MHVHGYSQEHDPKTFSNAISGSLGLIAMPEYDYLGDHIGRKYLPAFSLDYELRYKRKFGVLFMNEYVLNSFIAEDPEGDFIDREHILITSLNIGYSPFPNFSGYAGYGFETDLTNGFSYGVTRIGCEYGIPIRNDWYSIMLLAGDFRRYYASVSFEIGFAKDF